MLLMGATVVAMKHIGNAASIPTTVLRADIGAEVVIFNLHRTGLVMPVSAFALGLALNWSRYIVIEGCVVSAKLRSEREQGRCVEYVSFPRKYCKDIVVLINIRIIKWTHRYFKALIDPKITYGMLTKCWRFVAPLVASASSSASLSHQRHCL